MAERIFYLESSLENFKDAAEEYIYALDAYREAPGCMERDRLAEAENAIRELMELPLVDFYKEGIL